MPTTSAERQAKYRALRSTAGERGNGDRRINTWVCTGASCALARLAKHYGTSQRSMLERLIIEADNRLISSFKDDEAKFNAYLGC
jgi:hypothetical protein